MIIIFAACFLINLFMIFYAQKLIRFHTQKLMRRQSSVQLTDEEVLNNLSEIAQFYFEEQRKEKTNWHHEGF